MKRVGPSGVWDMVDGVPVARERYDVGPAIVRVPTEAVLLPTVDLPLTRHRERVAALPFAIEDRLCAPLGTLHLVLGPEVAPRSHVAAVVGHAVMTEWIAALAAAGLGDAAIVPDALLLPRPTTGSWRVERRGNRVIVRTDDGGGFAVPNDRFADMWARGGRLPCLVRGDAPDGLPTDSIAIDAATAVVGIPLDLRAGRYAVPVLGRGGAAWRAGAIVAVGMLAHTAIAAVDTVGVHGAVVADTAAPAARRTGLLPLLTSAMRAIEPRDGIRVERMDYAAGPRVLTLTIDGDAATTDRAAAAMTRAGLRVRASGNALVVQDAAS